MDAITNNAHMQAVPNKTQACQFNEVFSRHGWKKLTQCDAHSLCLREVDSETHVGNGKIKSEVNRLEDFPRSNNRSNAITPKTRRP